MVQAPDRIKTDALNTPSIRRDSLLNRAHTTKYKNSANEQENVQYKRGKTTQVDKTEKLKPTSDQPDNLSIIESEDFFDSERKQNPKI